MLGHCRHLSVFQRHGLRRTASSQCRSFGKTSVTLVTQPESIFTGPTSGWDFLDVTQDLGHRDPLKFSHKKPHRRSPRQSMTAHEAKAVEEMFAMIFDVVVAHERADASRSPPSSSSAVGGLGRGNVDDLIGKIRRLPQPSHQMDQVLDRKKEEIDFCSNDYELLEWAHREIFDESKRYEQQARKAIAEATSTGKPPTEFPPLQPPNYPYLLAHLMKTFRDTYNDPHLALSMFQYARHLSIASYVFGCSTPAYNELLQTHWKSFHNLTGVHGTIEEMKVNGVGFDSRTYKLVEEIRRDIKDYHVSVDSFGMDGREEWALLLRIEKLLSARSSAKPASKPSTRMSEPTYWDAWKRSALDDKEGDSWGFNQWHTDDEPRRHNTSRRLASAT